MRVVSCSALALLLHKEELMNRILSFHKRCKHSQQARVYLEEQTSSVIAISRPHILCLAACWEAIPLSALAMDSLSVEGE
jgi:hypothetical protein